MKREFLQRATSQLLGWSKWLTGGTRTARASAGPRRFIRISNEELPSLIMPAGNVMAWQDPAGILRVNGDSAANSAVVAWEGNGVFSVTTSTGTALQGAPSNVLKFRNVQGIVADMGEGNDTLSIVSNVPRAKTPVLFVVDVKGAERANVVDVQTLLLKINGGPNASATYVSGVVTVQAQVDTGDQADGVFFSGTTILGGLRVDTRGRDDHVQLVNTSVFGKATIRTDGGNDRLELLNSTRSPMFIQELTALMGDGNDQFQADGALTIGDSTIDGGAGTDRNLATARLPKKPVNFEVK